MRKVNGTRGSDEEGKMEGERERYRERENRDESCETKANTVV